MLERERGEASVSALDTEALKSHLISSSTRRRVSQLEELSDQISSSDLSEVERSIILQILFNTYPRYVDHPSRRAVQTCLRALHKASTTTEQFGPFIDRIQAEASKAGLASTSAFVLVEWCSFLLQVFSSSSAWWDRWALDLIIADAHLLELCVGSAVRRSVKRSALALTRRESQVILFNHPSYTATFKDAIRQLTTGGKATSAARNAIYLGLLARACVRLPHARLALEELKSKIYEFYVREILGSRVPVPEHIAKGLGDFFLNFSTEDDLLREVMPAVEKALLRAPEVVLQNVVPALMESISPEIDRSNMLYTIILKPLLSNVKSTNGIVRDGALLTFQVAASRCSNEAILEKIADEILKPLEMQKIPNTDQRVIHARMLTVLPSTPTLFKRISPGLAQVASKEPNENALDAETTAMVKHVCAGLAESVEINELVVKAISKGLTDKKPSIRRIWALRAGDLLWQLPPARIQTKEVSSVVRSTLPHLGKIWEDVAANPLAAVQNGLIVAAFIFAAIYRSRLAVMRKEDLIEINQLANVSHQSLNLDSKTSFLVNHRTYTKLTTEDDFIWFVRALVAMTDDVVRDDAEPGVIQAWAQAFLYLITGKSVKPTIRQEAGNALTAAYVKNAAQIGRIIISGLWCWKANIEHGEKDTAAMAARTMVEKVYLAVRSICISPNRFKELGGNLDEAAIEQQLVDLVVMCRPEVFPRLNWIEVCQKSGVDPGVLARERSAQLLDRILAATEVSVRYQKWKQAITRAESESSPKLQNISPALSKAAYNAAAELAFVCPDVFTDALIEQVQDDLNPERLTNIGPVEVAIYRTPEGTVFVDVLGQTNQKQAPSKSDKDYDTLKWEEELRAQLALKKGRDRKLTSEEQSKLDAQLAKEAAIRQDLAQVEVKIRRGAGIIQSLALGPPTEAEKWIGPAVSSLLAIVSGGAGLLVGDVASQAYLACSEQVTSRLGTLRKFIGVATLRSSTESQLPNELEGEPFGDQVSRVLYRLRFVAEQRPFDIVSFLYMLPLIFVVLEEGGVGRSQAEEADVQVVLALEFLAFHTDICSNVHMPRREILSMLISSMQKFTQHYKIIRECLHDLCRCMALNITEEELGILLKGTIAPQIPVRNCILQAIDAELELADFDSSEEIWLACHDEVEENAELGRSIWTSNALDVDYTSAFKSLPYLASNDAQLRRSAARATAEAVKLHPSCFKDLHGKLESIYRDNAKPLAPRYDKYGRENKSDVKDAWEARSGVALAAKELADVFRTSSIGPFIRFLIENGPLRDVNSLVRTQMVDAAITIVAGCEHGEVEQLMQMFESTLEAPESASEIDDHVKEAVVILYGALARHLKADDDRLPKVVEKLLRTLSTPSESIQYAVAECLPPLVRGAQLNISDYVQQMLDQLVNTKTYAARRGAAYGLAGIVLGRGISALREYRIMFNLQTSIENKKNANHRQGTLFAYEMFSTFLGRAFEPYTIKIVPQLLVAFGDSDVDVRDACLDAAKACFASLSSYGVKKILPTLLEGLNEQQWRSKRGACDLLGAMAYLDPRQLALSLPEIIPPLTDVLNDSHKEVRAGANRSLQRFGEVISNPEIKALVGVLLKAISDPIKHTDDALDSLIKMSFVHYLDAPSLALVVRILERGLSDRSATKRKSAQIIGSLAHLTERKDLVMHLPILVHGLKLAIVDPVPTTRATASKALGSLIEKLGEESLPDLIPSLMSTLKSETGAGDRLGSAQALSEVLAGLGTSRLEETLPTILQNVSSSKPTVREGFMSLFIFLPACFGNSFATYLGKIIPPILAGLADEIESIRETSLRAGHLLVRNFATRAVDLLLPELERGLADNSYHIRLSSVKLIGDLLFNLTGISADADNEDMEENAGEAGQSLLEVLGEEQRNRVLSSLYICRCDTSGLVRTEAINVWKAMVPNPRVLKELIPTLTQLLIRRLASSNMEQKLIAGNALGELIRKAGEGVLSALLPMLDEELQSSTDSDAKQGVCIALREIIVSAAPETLQEYQNVLISIVRTALVDAEGEVRESAAEAFDSLQRILGKRAVDQVLPHLLSLLRVEAEADHALSALLTLLTDNARSNLILPNLLPTLLTSPMSAFNAKALASLSEVAGQAITRRLPSILHGLIDNLISCEDEDLRGELSSSFDTILLSVDEYDGLNAAMSVMLAVAKHDDHLRRAAADYHLANFFREAEIDYSSYHQDLIRVLLISFDDRDPEVVKAAWTALTTLTSQLKKEEMEMLVLPTRQVLQNVGVPGSNLPGFSLSKGINAILPIFLQGLMNGTTEQRIQSALAISDIVDRTSADALKPFVTQITGPLIRVVSERSTEVRAAILLTLNNLLEKIPTFLKPFLPQLQRTFAKSLADTTSDILRARAAKALGTLITLTPRVDPLVSELVTGSKTTDTGVRNAMLKALQEVVTKAGGSMSEASRTSVLSLLEADVDEAEGMTYGILITKARLFGALVKYLPPANAKALLKNRVFTTQFNKSTVLRINAVLLEASQLLTEVGLQEIPNVIRQGVISNNDFISENSVLAAGKYLLHSPDTKPFESTKTIIESLAQILPAGNPSSTRRLALVVLRTVSRLHSELIRPHLALLAPPIFANVRDPIIPIKLSAEAAFLGLFSVVDDEATVFEKYISGPAGSALPPNIKRAMQDYFKRVALRLGAQARERREAEGGQGTLGLSSDEVEDEKEIWSVGRLEVGDSDAVQFG
ncbi:MAG: translational activator of GCN4 [Peltula sp. TS41687]|nr:MAG: translational activator of GCN4 [Peltula sp. TS41687]